MIKSNFLGENTFSINFYAYLNYYNMFIKKIILGLFFFIFFCNYFLSAQELNEKSIWAITDIPNRFVKGDDSLISYIKQNFNVCKKSKLSETIVLYFVIDPDSSITNLEFITPNETILKNDVVEMLRHLPKWIPGIQFGKVVRSARHLLLKCKDGEVVLPPYETPKLRN